MQSDKQSLRLKNQLCFPIYLCSKEIIRRYVPLLKKLDLTYTQYIVMMYFWENKQSNVRNLGKALLLDPSTLTPLLVKLEAKGFVTLEADPADKRKQRICLTEHCLRFCRENDSRSQQLMAQMFHGIPQEDILTTIRTIMQMEKQLGGLLPGKQEEETDK